MIETRDDGGVDLLDPLFERLLHLEPATVAALDEGDAIALSALDARHLRACPEADRLRRAAWYARVRPEPVSPRLEALDVRPLAAAVAALGWAQAWQDAERWRRLIENGRAGGGALSLSGLIPPALASAAADQAAAMPLSPMVTSVVIGNRTVVDEHVGGALERVAQLFETPAARLAFGAALGRALARGVLLNAWALSPGQRMAVHPDGARYAATLVVGLNAEWTAADGGAIAFGEPGPEGLRVRSRWLPHRGDVLVFAPTADTWHAVEPPVRTRWTLSGWWLG